jgi:ribonuclease BN (tRNA processing enzyme)
MPSIKLTTLGTGTPRPEPTRHCSCVLLEVGDDHLLFDAGRGAVLQLARKGVPWAALTRLFLTHHHLDHIGELPDVMITSWINGRLEPMEIYGPPPTEALVDLFLNQVYARDIYFREQEFAKHGRPEMAHFAAPVVRNVLAGVVAKTPSWTVKAYEVDHGTTQFDAPFQREWTCLGYRIEIAEKVVAISGDTVPCEGLFELAADADLLLQCCWLPVRELSSPYLKAVAHHTLACSDVVGKVASQARVKRLALTHTRAVTPASIDAILEDVRKDFSGEVVVAEDLAEFLV